MRVAVPPGRKVGMWVPLRGRRLARGRVLRKELGVVEVAREVQVLLGDPAGGSRASSCCWWCWWCWWWLCGIRWGLAKRSVDDHGRLEGQGCAVTCRGRITLCSAMMVMMACRHRGMAPRLRCQRRVRQDARCRPTPNGIWQ